MNEELLKVCTSIIQNYEDGHETDNDDSYSAAKALRERLIKERDGWKLAPIDPTQEMLDRGYLCIKLGRGAKSLWLEMMSAAPKE